MNTNHWIRRLHRWVSILFTLAVIINTIALMRKEQAMWIGFLALLPLVVLLLTGLYLFVLSVSKRQRPIARQPGMVQAET
jgi:ABC-type polysaccharide/polyol phosphate export permease